MKVKIGDLFKLFLVAETREKQQLSRREKFGDYDGGLIAARAKLTLVLQGCDAEVELTEQMVNQLVPFLTREAATIPRLAASFEAALNDCPLDEA